MGPLLTVAEPLLVLVGVTVLAVAAGVFFHPPLAAYLLLGATPLIVGVGRGSILPLLRPNEALALLLGGVLVARGLLQVRTGQRLRIRITAIDVSILVLAFAGSALPLLWLAARSEPITRDDVFYALSLWKYFGVYLIVRASVSSERHVRTCLWVSLAAAAIVGAVGILQSLGLFGVPQLLAAYYGAGEGLGRAASTLSNAQATADVMVFNLVIAAALLIRGDNRRLLLAALCVLFVFGTVASGTVSGAFGLLVALGAFAFITRRFGRVLVLFPVAVVAGIVLQPVIQGRLSNLDPTTGIPLSWVGRWRNLQKYFWPELFSDFNYLLGVRPAARVPIPQYLGLGEFVWIESGHTWLLWTGGLPFFLAFIVFAWVAIRAVARVARERADSIGAAATGSFAALLVVVVLMTFDPHLTLRGSADLNFALLALACTGLGASTATRRGAGAAARASRPPLRPIR